MMKFALAVSIFAATVSKAAYSTTPHEETSEKQSKYDNLCYHCIDEGNIFCTDNGGLTGQCMPASCEEDTLTGQAKRDKVG